MSGEIDTNLYSRQIGTIGMDNEKINLIKSFNSRPTRLRNRNSKKYHFSRS